MALYRKKRPDAYKRVWDVFKKYNYLLKELDSNEKYYEASNLLELKNKSVVN